MLSFLQSLSAPLSLSPFSDDSESPPVSDHSFLPAAGDYDTARRVLVDAQDGGLMVGAALMMGICLIGAPALHAGGVVAAQSSGHYAGVAYDQRMDGGDGGGGGGGG